MTKNIFTELPESLGDLENLEHLDVHMNALTSLPDSIIKLDNLKRLIVGNNQLVSLPENMEIMSSLIEVNLVGSGSLLRVPESWNKMNKLELLIIDEQVVIPRNLLIHKPRFRVKILPRNTLLIN